jgi:hypothetical protein
VRPGSLGETIQSVIADLRPEKVYSTDDTGQGGVSFEGYRDPGALKGKAAASALREAR